MLKDRARGPPNPPRADAALTTLFCPFSLKDQYSGVCDNVADGSSSLPRLYVSTLQRWLVPPSVPEDQPLLCLRCS